MYAVIKAGGKQHKVKTGDVLEIELVHGAGEQMTFTPILVVDDDGKAHFGKDVAKAVVTAKLVGEQKGEKVKVFKYRPKTGYARHAGHRQLHTLIQIEDVALAKRAASGAKKAEPKPKPAKAATAKAATLKATTPKAETSKASAPKAPRQTKAAEQPAEDTAPAPVEEVAGETEGP